MSRNPKRQTKKFRKSNSKKQENHQITNPKTQKSQNFKKNPKIQENPKNTSILIKSN